MNQKPYPEREWYTAIIVVKHTIGYAQHRHCKSIRGPFATAAETEKAIREFVPAKGEFSIGYVNHCVQTGWASYYGPEVTQNYDTSISAEDRARKAA